MPIAVTYDCAKIAFSALFSPKDLSETSLTKQDQFSPEATESIAVC